MVYRSITLDNSRTKSHSNVLPVQGKYPNLLLRATMNPKETLHSNMKEKARKGEKGSKWENVWLLFLLPAKEKLWADACGSSPVIQALPVSSGSAREPGMQLLTVCFMTIHLLVAQDRAGACSSGHCFVLVFPITYTCPPIHPSSIHCLSLYTFWASIMWLWDTYQAFEKIHRGIF